MGITDAELLEIARFKVKPANLQPQKGCRPLAIAEGIAAIVLVDANYQREGDLLCLESGAEYSGTFGSEELLVHLRNPNRPAACTIKPRL